MKVSEISNNNMGGKAGLQIGVISIDFFRFLVVKNPLFFPLSGWENMVFGG